MPAQTLISKLFCALRNPTMASPGAMVRKGSPVRVRKRAFLPTAPQPAQRHCGESVAELNCVGAGIYKCAALEAVADFIS